MVWSCDQTKTTVIHCMTTMERQPYHSQKWHQMLSQDNQLYYQPTNTPRAPCVFSYNHLTCAPCVPSCYLLTRVPRIFSQICPYNVYIACVNKQVQSTSRVRLQIQTNWQKVSKSTITGWILLFWINTVEISLLGFQLGALEVMCIIVDPPSIKRVTPYGEKSENLSDNSK